MDITALMEYFDILVVGICLCVGYMIKHAFLNEKLNRFIPMIMGILGLTINILCKHNFTADIVLGGLFSGLASTGLYEAFKNLIVTEEE